MARALFSVKRITGIENMHTQNEGMGFQNEKDLTGKMHSSNCSGIINGTVLTAQKATLCHA